MSCKYVIGNNTFNTESEVADFIKSQSATSFLSFLKSKLDTQQTVARKYEEIVKLLEAEKNVETVTDTNGFDWYEAQITQEDKSNPVVAFSIGSNALERISQQTINAKVNTYQSANDIGLEIVNLYPQSKSKDIQKEFNECAI